MGYLGITTGWLGLGRNHLIPACNLTVAHDAETVHVPYTEDVVKNSPSFESVADLEDELELRVNSHYGISSKQECCSTDKSKLSVASTETIKDPETVEIPLMEEQLKVGKRDVALGEVRLRKIVRSEIVNQPVELRREEVVVERVTSNNSRPGADAFVEKVISIPISQEEAVIEKTVHSAGAVQARKVVETEQRNVSETIRKEDVEVNRDSVTKGNDR